MWMVGDFPHRRSVSARSTRTAAPPKNEKTGSGLFTWRAADEPVDRRQSVSATEVLAAPFVSLSFQVATREATMLSPPGTP